MEPLSSSGSAHQGAPSGGVRPGGGMAEVQEQMREVLRLRNEHANDPNAPRLKLSELQALARKNVAANRAAAAAAEQIKMQEAQALADTRAKAAAQAAVAREAKAKAAAANHSVTRNQAASNGPAPDAAAAQTHLAAAAHDDQDIDPADEPGSIPAGGDTPGPRDDRHAVHGARGVRDGGDVTARSTGRAAPLMPGEDRYGEEPDRDYAERRYVEAAGAALAARFDERLALTQQSIERVASRAYSGVAAAMAMPNLTPREPGGVLVAAGAARYRCGSAFAAGATYRTRNSRWLVHAALALTDRGDTGMRTHIGYEF